jgi:D-sedoheptulose 7-phosphate isomerase
VLISSSGRSPSVLNAAIEASQMGIPVLTLTGFAPDNPLRAAGTVNLWVDDQRYNMVEATHQSWLVAMVDALAGIPVESVQ